MDESITITVNILLKILPHKMNQLHTLAKIFDANVPYYTGELTHIRCAARKSGSDSNTSRSSLLCSQAAR